MDRDNFNKKEKKLIRSWIESEFKELDGRGLYCRWEKSWDGANYYDLDFRIFIPMNKDFYNDVWNKKLYQVRHVRVDFFIGDKIDIRGEFTFSFSHILHRLNCSFCRIEIVDHFLKNGEVKKGLVLKTRLYMHKGKLKELEREEKLKLLNI